MGPAHQIFGFSGWLWSVSRFPTLNDLEVARCSLLDLERVDGRDRQTWTVSSPYGFVLDAVLVMTAIVAVPPAEPANNFFLFPRPTVALCAKSHSLGERQQPEIRTLDS